jgi:hypothetical protein
MVEITARWVINAVNSVQSITGQANTHYTDECHMYNPDGSRKYQKGKSNGDKKTLNFSQQLQAQ